MKSLKNRQRGQALVIIAFAIMGLVAAAGLAIDGSNTFADRRAAQNAADTAALAAAVTRNTLHQSCIESQPPSSCWLAVVKSALDRAFSNGYTNDIVHNTVEVHSPPIDGPYANCSSASFNCTDYIQVIIHTNVNTVFARVIGVGQTHNRVEAVALAQYATGGSLYDGNSLVALSPSGCGGNNAGVYVSGQATVVLNGGGIYDNSNDSTCAFKMGNNGCTNFQLNNGATLTSVGGVKAPSCQNPPPVGSSSYQYKYPPVSPVVVPPPECGVAGVAYIGADGLQHLKPGHYSSIFLNGGSIGNIVLDPGNFCVDSGVKQTGGTMNGQGVFIYIKPGGSFNFSGGTTTIVAPGSGTYKGYLIYNDGLSGNLQNCTVNGGSGNTYTGTIYAPYCNVTLNGGSTPTGFSAQLIAYSLTINGTSTVTFTYNASQLASTPPQNNTGIYR
jgi:hypothetical protein